MYFVDKKDSDNTRIINEYRYLNETQWVVVNQEIPTKKGTLLLKNLFKILKCLTKF